jgi:hypothetical protein
MTSQFFRLPKKAIQSPRFEEQRRRLAVYGKTEIVAMNQSYIEVILASLFIATCYLFIVPV